MAKLRKYTEADLAKMLDAAGEALLHAPDEEVLAEIRDLGEDPAAVAQEVRSILLNALTQHKKAKLHAAEIQHSFQVEELNRRKAILPGSSAGRRRLLEKVLASLSTLSSGQPAMATIQYRMGSELTDEEVSQQLQQMSQLGLLDATAAEEEEG